MKKNLLPLVVCSLTTSFLFAQVDLKVSVNEYKTGMPVSGQVVRLENSAIGYLMTGATNALGQVVFKGLPVSGTYLVESPATDRYDLSRREGIEMRANTDLDVQLVLIPRDAVPLEEVTVSGATPINTINAEVSSELRRKEVEELPLEGRDITRILYRMPNVTQATGFYPEAPNVSINGANSLFTNYLVDGMDNNERFLGGMKFNIPVGFTQNINVLTNNFSSEYGLTANGVVNVTSRSGNNTYTGEAYVITRPGTPPDAASPYAQRDLSGNQVKDGFQRYQAGFAVGGPLQKDKTFYFLNAEYTRDIKDNLLVSPALGVSETVRGENNFTYLSARVDHLWSNRFRTALRANLGVINIARQGGGLDGGATFPSAANYQDRNSALVALQNTYLGDAFKSETNLQYGRFRWNYARPEEEGNPQTTVLDPQEFTVAIVGSPDYVFDETENTFQFQEKLSFYLNRHTLKAGFEVISADHRLLGGGNVNGNYTVKLDSAQLAALRAQNLGADLDYDDIPADAQVLQYNVELRPQSLGARQNIFSVYLEDDWSVNNRLNLTAGLRYDYDNLSKGGGDRGDFNNIGPRLSANYKLDARSSLRTGYGIFYDRILYAVYSDALQQNTTGADYRKQLQALIDQGILPADTDLDKITFDGNLSATVSGVDYLQGPTSGELQDQREKAFSNDRRILNPEGYQNPYAHQFMLGFQHQLDNKRLFYVDAVFNRSENLFRLRDLNAPSAYVQNDANNITVRTQAEADLTRPVPIQNSSATINGEVLTGVARNVVVSETGGSSEYAALSFNLQKSRADDRYEWRLIYTLSRLNNDTEDINFRAEDSNNFDREWGPGINDRTHVINGWYTYYPWRNMRFTIAGLLQSGQPINRIPDATVYGTTDLNGDGRAFGEAYVGNSDRHPGEPRNSDRLPWSNVFDLTAEYFIPLSHGRLALRADVFNLLNTENLSGYANNATQSNQIQAGAASSGVLVRRNAGAPRQFQFGLRYLFGTRPTS
ncbi:MAG: TonB-dependent receptor [Saprospiraceae bacterium]|nr:TonB-dependent receptor [Saprospiraceae bacterium]